MKNKQLLRKKRQNIRGKLLFALLFFLSVSVLFSTQTQAAKAKKKKAKVLVTSVKLKNVDSSFLIEPGQSKQLTISVLPSNATNKKVKWSSSNTSVVSVSSKGKIKGIKEGKATITVTAKDASKKKAKVTVTVGKKVKSITFTNTASLTKLPVGQTFKLKTQVLPEDAVIKTKKWTTSNAKVATVKSGVITAVGNGTATIKATAKDGSGKYASYKVKVITLAKSVLVENPLKRTYLQKGESVTLQATVKPATTTNKSLTWTSENPAVATVSSKGVVKAVGNGTTSIKATTKDGTLVYDKCTINVISLRNQDTKFIAHRGYSTVAPENSGAAFRAAIEAKFWGVECDLRKTADGQFVIHHDDSILNDYGVNKLISQTNLADLQKLKIVSGYGVDIYNNEKMLTLKDFMDIVVTDENIQVFIELKDYYTKDEVVEVLKIVNEYNINDRITIISTKVSNINRLTEAFEVLEEEVKQPENTENENTENENTATENLSGENVTGDNTQKTEYVRPRLQLVASAPANPTGVYKDAIEWCIAKQVHICANYATLTQDMVDRMHDANLEVGVYTINNFYTAFVYAKAVGVDTITTDKVLFN